MRTTNTLTFNSLTFYNIGTHEPRGCRARARLHNGLNVEVYGGLRGTESDGAHTFDTRLSDHNGNTVRVPGYPPVLKCVTQDDVTCFMVHAQRHARIRLPKRQKPTKINA